MRIAHSGPASIPHCSSPLLAAAAALALSGLAGCGEAVVVSPVDESPDAALPADAAVPEADASEEDPPDDPSDPDAGEDVVDPDSDAGATDAGTAEPTDGGAATPAYRVPDNTFHEALRFGSSPAVIFRWRADGTSTSAGTLSAGVDVTEVRRPSPLSSFRYATFDGSPTAVSPGYVGSSAITAQNDGFTIQAWFRAHAVDGSRTLFSNHGSGKGVSLKISNGFLRLVFSAATEAGTVTRHYVADTSRPIEPGRWYHAVGTVARTGSAWRARIFLDGERLLTKEIDFTKGNLLSNSTEKPAVAAEPTDGAPDKEGFDGDLHAVVVHNYQLDRDVLGAPLLRDGGRYFGAPSYHDYLTNPETAGTAGANPPYSDRRYNLARRITLTDRDARFTGLVATRARLGLPLLNDRYVPGGVAVSADGRTMWLGYRYVSDTGTNPDGRASFLAEADLPSARITRLYRLVDSQGGALTWALDGLAAAKGFVYTAEGGRIHRFDPGAATLEAAGDADAPGAPGVYRLAPAESYAVRTSGTGLSYDAERDALWISAYRDRSAPQVDGALDRYDLASGGDLARPSAASSDERILPPSSLAFIRGAARVPSTAASGAGCFLLSVADTSSQSAAPSEVRFFCPELDRSVVRARLSYGARGLALGPDGTAWVVSQSGAGHLQKRANAPQWYDALTPYVLGYSVASLTPSRATCVEGEMLPFLGDIHTHTSYSDGCRVTPPAGTSCSGSDRYVPSDLIAKARSEGLDFIGVTDHHKSLTASELSACHSQAAQATAPGSFLAFCGFEAQVYPGSGSRDHTNVFLKDVRDSAFDRPTTFAAMLAAIKKCAGSGCYAQFNHPASESYPYADRTWSASGGAQMQLVEFNGGSAANSLTLYEDFLARGWRVGPTNNSDTHRLTPGNGGKRTGVYLSHLDLASLHEGLKAGRTFASNSGSNASLELRAEGCWMGGTLRGYLRAGVSVLASSVASKGFSRIELRAAGGTVLKTLTCSTTQASCSHNLDLDVDPAVHKFVFARAIRSDNTWLVSAPIWFTE